MKQFTKFGVGKEFQARTLMPNFTVVTFKMWAYSPQNCQNLYFWYKFAQKGYTSLYAIFTKFNLGKELQVPTIMPNFVVVALKCGFIAPKIAKNGNFWYIYICA